MSLKEKAAMSFTLDLYLILFLLGAGEVLASLSRCPATLGGHLLAEADRAPPRGVGVVLLGGLDRRVRLRWRADRRQDCRSL